jgi:MYXO-CTERM domain-containing protein
VPAASRSDHPARGALSSSARACAALGVAIVLAGCADPGLDEPVGTAEEELFANDVKVCNYFVAKGLRDFQAAGIVGNLDQESGDSPGAVQPGGPGRGVAQWSVGGRWDTDANDNAKAYAAQHGQDVWSLGLQLDFVWYELASFPGYGLGKLKGTGNVADATVAFQTDFEGCGQCMQSQRIAYAQAVLPSCKAAAPPAYAASFVSQSFPYASTTMKMVEGQVIPSYLELKNTGAKAWDSNTRLGTTQPRDRKSAFADGTWISPDRPAGVSGTVAPGGTHKFAFDLRAPDKPGVYDEFFGMVEEGVAWFSDGGQGGPPDNQLEVKIEVVAPDYRGAFKDQSFPLAPTALTVHEGDVAKGFIELTNTGAKPWKAGTTKLAPIPRDKPSPFADASWLSPTRVSTVAADVAPGAVGRFDVALDATAVGDTEIGFGLVEEGVTWFADGLLGGGPADGFLKVHLVVVPKEASVDAGAPAGGDGGGGSGGGSSEGGGGGAPAGQGGGGSTGAGAGGAAGDAVAGETPKDDVNGEVQGSCAASPSPGGASSWPALLGAALALGAVARVRRRTVRAR